MAVSTQPYKGARDFYPDDKRLQKWLFGKWREVCESFGYEEYDAPILEPTDLYLMKGSEEIIAEQTYTFTDRGDRSVTIRTEMTPTVSRMVARQRQELAYPLRWYSIPNLWRYERTQRGRLREFWQLNADIFGVNNLSADHEIILLADACMKALGANDSMYSIRINSRELMNFLLHSHLGLDEAEAHTVSRLIDRMHKINPEEFENQLAEGMSPAKREAGTPGILLDILRANSVESLPPELQQHPATKKLQQLFTLLQQSGVNSAVFDITMMRGFDYYTDIVFEIFDTHPDNNRALGGGGRYDGLVELFGVEPVPTVGIGIGDVGMMNFLETHQLLPQLETETDIYVVLLGESVYEKAQQVLSSLRDMGVRIAVDATNRKVEKQIKTAVKKGIPYALFIGETELNEGQFSLKTLSTGQEERGSLEHIVSLVNNSKTYA